MFSINGQIFSGSNVTIVNGRVISGGKTGKSRKFDERKSEDCSNIDKIVIDSTVADVSVSVTDSSEVEAYFYGEAEIDGDVDFDLQLVNRELRITLHHTGNCFNGSLKLDITVPRKTFREISAKSSSGDITLNEGVSTDYLQVTIQSGDLETSAIASSFSVSMMSGDVELRIDAIQDINVNISIMSGDVSAEFNNIGHINLSASSMAGNVKNRHKEGNGYIANVNISTMSGNIRIG